jgi:hypothetical protein
VIRQAPIAITFLLGTFFILEIFVPHHGVHAVADVLLEWALIISAAAYILGIVNIVQVNVPHIRRREADWPYKVVLLVSAFTMTALGLVWGRDSAGYLWIFNHVFQACNATMFSLLAFFIASAAFRAFRVRNSEAFLLLLAAIIVMFGRLSVAEMIWDGFLDMAAWTLDFPNNAGKRAILIGIALGAVSTGLRVILGLERSHLGGD